MRLKACILKFKTFKHNSQQGVMIITVVIFALIMMITVSSLVGYTMLQIKSQRQAVGKTMGISIAEAAIEATVWKLNNQPGYSGETGTSYGGGVYNITISNVGNNKLVKAEAFVPDAINPKAKQVVQVTVSNGAENIAFNYGIHVGTGGLKMDNNSEVRNGNVYANSTILGDNQGVKIGGTAIASGANGKIDEVDSISGNASAHYLEDVIVGGSTSSASLLRATVTGNAVSDSISTCTITGNAIYDTKSSCTIGGAQSTPNPTNFVNPPVIDLPIPDSQVVLWQNEAAAAGTVSSQTISGTVSLGPKKINGNLTLNNGSTLIVTGTLWVTGAITLSNNSTMQLDSDYGTLSGVVVAGTAGSSTAGVINAQNGSTITGSGTAGSYLMMLSQRDNSTSTAISVSNNASGAIFYAGYGVIEVYNVATVKEVTAEKVHLNQNTIVNYELGLANAQFSTGPGGGWEVLDGTWQLLQ